MGLDPIANALLALQAYNDHSTQDLVYRTTDPGRQPSLADLDTRNATDTGTPGLSNLQNLNDSTAEGARAAMSPYEQFQSYDPTSPSFQAPPYGDTTIQMPDDATRGVGHLPSATPKSVPVMSDAAAAYRNGDEPTSVAGATDQENRALDDVQSSAQDASDKKQAADADTQNRLADVYHQSYQEQAKADQDYQTARSMSHQQADAETNQWMQDMQDQAVKEPNPHRWFDNKSSFGKAMWALSLVAGSFQQGLSGGQLHNVALETAQKSIQDDMNEQKARLDRELGVLKEKGQVLNQRQLRNLTDLGDDHTRALGRLNALQQEYLARAAAPGKAQNDAADAQVNAWFAQAKQGIYTKRREEAVRTREEQLSRAQALRLAQMTDSRDRAIATANIQKDYDLAKLQAEGADSAARAKASAEAHKEETRISSKSGIKVIDDKTGQVVGDGSLYVSNHLKPEEVAAKINTANDMGGALQDLQDAIQEASTGSMAAKTAVKAQQALAKIQVAKAGGKLAKLSDKDMDVFTQTVTGLGNNSLTDRLRTGFLKDDVLTAIGHARDSIKPETDADLSIYAPEGTHIDYSGINTRPADQRAPTPDEQVAALGGTVPPKKVPSSPEELRKARERGEAPELTTSSGAGQYAPVVQKLEQDVQGATPDHIKRLAAAALSAVTPDQWAGKPGSAFAQKALIPAYVEDALKVAESNEKRLVNYLVEEQTANGPRQFAGAGSIALTPAHVKEIAATEFHLTNGVDADYIDELMKAVEAKLRK